MGANIAFEPINQISRARNTGAENARGKWFLFIDADTYPCSGLMAEVLDIIGDGDYIGCGTTVIVEEGTLFKKLFRLFNWSGGALLLCEGEAFRTLGGFSTDLYAYEEIDFVLRLKRYGRKRGKKFTVLHRHPVITSGRKGEYGLCSLKVLFISNFVAVILFGLHYLLPKGIIRKLGSKLFGYWYKSRR